MANVQCSGTETSLNECAMDGWFNTEKAVCTSADEACVLCEDYSGKNTHIMMHVVCKQDAMGVKSLSVQGCMHPPPEIDLASTHAEW